MDNVLTDINHTTVEALGFKNDTSTVVKRDIGDYFTKGGITVKLGIYDTIEVYLNTHKLANRITLDELKALSKLADDAIRKKSR